MSHSERPGGPCHEGSVSPDCETQSVQFMGRGLPLCPTRRLVRMEVTHSVRDQQKGSGYVVCSAHGEGHHNIGAEVRPH